MMRRRLPRYVSEFKDRHGRMRVRFRRKGQEAYYFKATPWTEDFMVEYQACLDKKTAPAIEPGKNRTRPGSISQLIINYYGSPEYKGLGPATHKTYRSQLERFRAEHGDKPVAGMERRHIRAILGAMSETPSAANNLLDRIRMLMEFAIDEGMRRDNPALGIKGYKITSDGFHTWTEPEILQFEDRHPIGSKARLAMALMLFTGQRRSDAFRMGWQHVAAGRIKVRQQKTNKYLEVRIHQELAEVLANTPRDNLTFLLTEYGKPFANAGFGNWFRDRCDEAGLPQCSAHGLRKAASRRLAESGCTHAQIKAVTGHSSDAEVARYIREADQRILSDEAYRNLVRGGRAGTEMATLPVEVSQNEE